ncbi:MAG TPA: hypothetical protein VMW89_15135 [Desulfatiglandales bacterium]|nr:hypothetical protein [Desulfatiglandales bacterium]
MKTVTYVRLEKELREQLERAAKEDRRTLSNLIGKILEDWVRDRIKDHSPDTSK